MALELRVAEGRDDAIKAFVLFKAMHEEGLVPGSFHPLKTLSNVLRMVNGPGSCVLMAMNGDEAVGVLGLFEEAYWWSEDRFLGDKGFYVLPKYRDAGAFDVLLQAAQQAGDDLGLQVVITIANHRRKRGTRSKWERVGATLGYSNLGAVIARDPEN